MTSTQSDIAIVQTWHDTLNRGDLDGFAALLDENVEFVGPRGLGHGAAMVRDWASRAGIELAPERWFAREGEVVVTQRARWRDAETGRLGEPIAAASAFRVRDGRVRRIARFDTLDEALAAAGLDASDEAPAPSHVLGEPGKE